MKEYKVDTKQEAIVLALELTEDKAVQRSAIEMLDFMPTFIMTEEGSYSTLMLVGANGPIGNILFSETA